MSAGGEIIIAGQYTVTYNAVATGIFFGDDGMPTVSQAIAAQMIDRTDAWGDTAIDGIYRGGNWFFNGVFLEYRSGTKSLFWPPHATIGRLGVIGRRLFDMSAALVMTAIAGTPASAEPATLTASKAILDPGFTSSLKFGPMTRVVPIRLRLFPYDTGGGAYAPIALT